MPAIYKFENVINDENVIPLIEALNDLNRLSENKIFVDEFLVFLKQLLVYKQTKMKPIEENQLLHIIKNDLKYYKEKELEKMKRSKKDVDSQSS